MKKLLTRILLFIASFLFGIGLAKITKAQAASNSYTVTLSQTEVTILT